MMDKAYILENNILEQYLLGELNFSEQEELEQTLANDATLKQEFTTLENSLERMAMEHAITPPETVKASLMQAVRSSNGRVIQMNQNPNIKMYLAVVASVAAVLLIGFVYLFTQFNYTQEQLQVVEQENSQLKENVNGLNQNIEDAAQLLALLNSPDTQQYILEGNALSPNAKIVSYVNHDEKAVVINTKNLPKLDDTKDYQMWADVEGEMINMGVIDKNKELLAMNYIDNAESLNVTIEPAGGSDHPTVANLVSNVFL